MLARRCDDVTAIIANVDAGAENVGGCLEGAVVAEQEVLAARAGGGGEGERLAFFLGELCPALCALLAFTYVYVDDRYAAVLAGG